MPDEFQTLKKERCIEIIKAYNGSGMPKRQWCREHGIGYSTFMRWQRSLRNELAGEIMVTQAVVVCSFDSKPQTELYVLQSYTVKEIDQKGNRPISLAIRKGEFSQEILTVRVWQA